MSKIQIHPAPTAFTEDGGLLLALPAISKTWTKDFIADENIEVGECLELDFAGVQTIIDTAGIAKTFAKSAQVEEALDHVRITDAVAAGCKGFIGVALQTVASGAKVRVAIAGYVPFVQSAGSVADGDYLALAAAGEVILYASGTHTAMGPVGFALSDDADIGSAPDEAGCAMWLYPTCLV